MAEIAELKDATATEKVDVVTPKPAAAPANPIRRITIVVLLLAIVIFVYGMISDRLTPYTDQATVQAYVVTVAPDISGRVVAVGVVDNQSVKAGQILFVLDPERYEIAVDSAEAQLSTAGQAVGASTANLAAAEARLVVAEANLVNVEKQSARVFELVRSGVRAKANGDEARAALHTAVAEVERAKADVEQARQNLGPQGANNPEIRQARAALRKAQRDVRDTVVRAPSNGEVTNLQLAPGRFVSGGQTALTFIDSDVIWIDSELRENALEHIKVGNPVDIALDVRPGRVYAGKVESIGWGVDSHEADAQTGLPAIENDSGWVREPQRFAVRVRFDPDRRPSDIRVGSQASLVVYTESSSITDAIGWLWIRLVSYLSYLN
jgi:multidrug resistance efflux pump